MTLHQLHNTLSAFLARIESKTGTDLHDAFVGEVIETGGTYLAPNADDNTTSHPFEFSLHGIIGRGPSEPEAFANWRQAAQRLIKASLTQKASDTCRGGNTPKPHTLPETVHSPSPAFSNAHGGQG